MIFDSVRHRGPDWSKTPPSPHFHCFARIVKLIMSI